MELKHIDIAKLCVSAANMRAKGKPDLSHILPSIRARGVLVPLIVRPTNEENRFEIVAGKRRYHAALAVAGLLIEHFESMELDWPPPHFDVEAEKSRLDAAD